MLNKSLLHASWLDHLNDEFDERYMIDLNNFLEKEKKAGSQVYPTEKNIFSAFNHTNFADVRVVILGQDPYHGCVNEKAQAHGLSFSVQEGIKPPPSLANIFKELKADINMKTPSTGHLLPWAKEGVLLLNSVLTVRAHEAGSHRHQGWEKFTDKVIHLINEQHEGIVFILWGSNAQKKAALVNQEKHLILSSVHPSPLSAYRGFFGCKHFSQTNKYFLSQKKPAISWLLD